MSQTLVGRQERVERALNLVKECSETMFDNAPVMMHSIDANGQLIRVNQRWLETLGYERDEVLGKKSIDFLTEESRTWAINDTLPLFWTVGSARGIGYEFVKKDGRVINILLDAEVSPDALGEPVTLAALRNSHDILQWQQASASLDALRHLTVLQARLEDALSTISGVGASESRTDAITGDWWTELWGLLELAGHATSDLQSLAKIQEEYVHPMVNQQQTLSLLAQTLDLVVAELVEAVPPARKSS